MTNTTGQERALREALQRIADMGYAGAPDIEMRRIAREALSLPQQAATDEGEEWEGELTAEEQAKIDAAWEKHKAADPVCRIPPEGWSCSRAPGHNGPCAATPTSQPPAAETRLREAHKAGWTAAEIKYDLRKGGTVFDSEEDAWEAFSLARAALTQPEPTTGFCNKCGYHGPIDAFGQHKRPHDGELCNYVASKAQPGPTAQQAECIGQGLADLVERELLTSPTAQQATELDANNEAMVCAGCGTTKTVAFIKANSPTAFTCCPERKMIPVRAALTAEPAAKAGD